MIAYWNLQTFLLVALLGVGFGKAAPHVCTLDSDCSVSTVKLGAKGEAAYLCIKGFCTLAVSAKQACFAPTDCSQYHWVSRQLSKNISLEQQHIHTNLSSAEYLDSLCSPSFCELGTTCHPDYSSFLSFNPNVPYRTSCCGGGSAHATCDVQNPVSTCSGASCQVSSSEDLAYCIPKEEKSGQWIGIIFALVGAAFSNIGLNLQKLALRKRHEKTQKKMVKNRLAELFRNGALRFKKLSRSFEIRKSRDDTSSVITASNTPDLPEESSPESSSSSPRVPISMGITMPPCQPQNRKTSNAHALVTQSDGQSQDVDVVIPTEENITYKKELEFKTLIRNPVWVLGLLVFVFSNFFNFVALQYAPQSLVAPLGSASLVVNVIAAPLLNKEMFTWKDLIGVVIIVSGSSMTVAFAGVSSDDYTICILLLLFQRFSTIIFLSILFALTLFIFLTILLIEKNMDLKSEDNLNDTDSNGIVLPEHQKIDIELPQIIINPATPVRRNTTVSLKSPVVNIDFDEPVFYDTNSLAREKSKEKPTVWSFLKKFSLIPSIKTKFGPESKAVRIILPFSYASLGGIMATTTTLFAKATIHLLSDSFTGNDQFGNFWSWVILGVTVVTAISQVYWINMGLQRYDALLQIPVFYCVWTIFDVVGGGIYFDEFKGFNVKQYSLFLTAIAIIFGGVFLLADRLKKSEEIK